MIVVDYIQLMRTNSKKNEGRVQEISEITQGLKALAKELSVPVLALSQLSRAVEQRDDKQPQLADLRESGSIEQDADVVMFVYREAYYLERKQPKLGSIEYAEWQSKMNDVNGLADIILGKQRHGPTGTVKVEFEGLTTFYAGVRILDSFFIKAGTLQVDLNTKENLGTGSTYGNTTVDGSMVGVGMDKVMDNGMFVRVEGQYSEFDSASLTSSSGSQKITMESLDGVVGKLSIGKAF